MKTLLAWVLLAVASLTLLHPPQAQADDEVGFDYFYDALAPYGTWVEIEGFGPCWSPGNMDADWSPYTDGEWIYTEGGWTWQGNEPFSSIVDHYGRWILAGSMGWCWVPGYDWAPAWVSWRDGDEYVGWAPLPPEVPWNAEVGIGDWVDVVYGIGPAFYCFCHHRDFGEHRLRSVLMARSWNTTLLVHTHNITHMAYNRTQRHIVAGGLDLGRAQHFSASPITSLHLEFRNDFHLLGDNRHLPLPGGLVAGSSLVVTAPHVVPTTPGQLVRPPDTHKIIGVKQLNHGWSGKGASGNLDFVRNAIQTENQGHTPLSNPVRPLVTSVAPVPVQNNSASAIPLQPQSTAVVSPPATGAIQPQPATPAQRIEALESYLAHSRQRESELRAQNQALQAEQQHQTAVRQENEAALSRQQADAAQREQFIRQQGAATMARKHAEEQEQRRNEAILEHKRQEQIRTEAQQRLALEASREHARQTDMHHHEASSPPSAGRSRDDDEHKKKR